MKKKTITGFIISVIVWLMMPGCTTSQAPKEILEIEGLNRPVEIVKDHWGISHIYARNQQDLFFAQGFNVARDRLFQLELWRRRATGTVAEILGPRALRQDIGARLLRARVDIEQEMSHYHPDGIEIISSFVNGINAYIDLTSRNPDLLPVEFKMLGLKPDYWTPEVVVSRHNGLFRNVGSEISLARRLESIDPADLVKYSDFQPEQPDLQISEQLDLSLLSNRITSLYSAGRSSIRFTSEDILPEYRAAVSAIDESPNIPESGMDIGSNNWVVSSDLTETGKPFMANDPHRSQQIPSLRYWVHLNAPGWNVIGGGEPVLPGVSIGHNEYGAWGLTIFAIDQEDLCVYDTNPADPDQYRYGDNWETMTITRETIPVKGRMPEEVELKYTRHGPVLYEDRQNNKAYALRAAWLEIGGAPYLASLRMDQARNWEEFREACSFSHTPSENMIWADIHGDIGWQAVGITPIRRNWYGLLPIPGDGSYEWDGYLPIRELPNVLNPVSGFFGSANENNVPDGYPHRLGYSWSDPSRSMRIHEVLSSGNSFSMMDMIALQQDELSLPARSLVPLLNGIDPSELGSDLSREAQSVLLAWNFIMDRESIAATIFSRWRGRLFSHLRSIWAPQEYGSASLRPSTQQAIRLLNEPDSRFGSDPASGRDEIVVRSLDEAVAGLIEDLGADISGWKYGQPAVHYISMRHILSRVIDPEYSPGFDLGPLPRGGSGSTVNNTGSGNQRSGASFRFIADISNWDNSVGTNNPGQSGNTASPHYSDLFEMWAGGDYFPVYYSRSRIRSVTENRTILRPER